MRGTIKIALLDAGKTRSVLKRLIEDYDDIQIAVAWGYNGKLADLLMENSSKFHSVTFGLNGFATSPDLVDRLIGTRNAFIAKANNGIFHPKLYLFRAGDNAEAVVGSANFTKGGLDRNQRGQRDPILPDDKNGGKGLTSPLSMMSWKEFAAAAKIDPHHNFKRRMKLLREIQRLFASVERFSDLTTSEWKGIAGTLGKSERAAAGLDIHDWGWFGSMGGNGDFAGLILRQDRQLSDAVDCIPRKDPVSREDFEEYCRRFRKAFTDADAHHVGEFPTATRLLAMKRPDTFVCANGKNKGNLAEALSFAPTTLSLANYWDRIIVPIQSSPWYNAPHPSGGDGELWDYRVAMLDTLYYDEDA